MWICSRSEMAGTRISDRLPPQIDPDKAPVAFGNGAVPRLMRELEAEERCVQRAALWALCDLLHDPERVYEAVCHGFLERLKTMLKDEDEIIRTKTAEVLYVMSIHSIGREAFLKHDVLGSLSELLDDQLDACRRNLHQTLKMLAEVPTGVVSMGSLGLVLRLVMKVSVEPKDIRELVLSTLTSCMRVDPVPALACDVVSVLKEQLKHPSANIRREATSAMMGVSVPVEGKVRACELGVVPVLVELLSDDEPDIRANAAGAIMYITVITQGKCRALEAGAVPPLLRLVRNGDATPCTNALRALTCLAHAPSGRLKLLDSLPQLEALLSHPVPIVQKAAATTIEVISWKP